MLQLSIPSPSISYFDIGALRIHFYALCILTGIIIATLLTQRRLAKHGAERGIVIDIALWAVVLGIIGGRLYHVVTHPNDYFFPGADLLKTLYVWEGGLAIFGAIIFGGLGTYFACRRQGLRFFAFADALVPGMLFAQAFGRFGNYFNQELFGEPTTLPWGLQISQSSPAFPPGLPADTLFHPLFLYEMIWNIAGATIILLIDRKISLHSGKALAIYLIWYGSGRAWFESFRLDPTEFDIAGWKINVITAIVMALIGLVLLIVQLRRNPAEPTSAYLPGREPKPADASAPVPADEEEQGKNTPVSGT